MTAEPVKIAIPRALEEQWLVSLRDIRTAIDTLQASVNTAATDHTLGGFSAATHHWVRSVMGLVGEEFCVPISEISGPSRHASFVRPRFVAVWLIRSASNYSSPQIARLVNRSDHSTVLYACRRVEGWRDGNPEFRAATDALLTLARELREAQRLADIYPNPTQGEPS